MIDFNTSNLKRMNEQLEKSEQFYNSQKKPAQLDLTESFNIAKTLLASLSHVLESSQEKKVQKAPVKAGEIKPPPLNLAVTLAQRSIISLNLLENNSSESTLRDVLINYLVSDFSEKFN